MTFELDFEEGVGVYQWKRPPKEEKQVKKQKLERALNVWERPEGGREWKVGILGVLGTQGRTLG